MKLLLTSSGFDNPCIVEEFVALSGKRLQDVRILFIPTAARTGEEMNYVEFAKEELFKLGVKRDLLLSYNLERELAKEELAQFDCIYVCGGNTFFLAKRLRESGFGGVVTEQVCAGKLFVGVSAGSNIAGPTIRQAAPFDPNDVGLTDFSGLNLTTIVTIPHAQRKPREVLKRIKEEIGPNTVLLLDGEALAIDGQTVKHIRR